MQKILIVDDIDTNRMLLKKILSAMDDYEFIEAVNGVEGIEQFKNEFPDLVLMDVNMPILDGYRSASAIKSLSGNRYTPIIFITALSADSSLKFSIESGGDDFISKPFSPDVLESKIKAHLRIRELNELLNVNNGLLTEHIQRLQNEQELIEHFFEKALEQSFLDKEIIKYHMSSLSTFNGDVFLVKQGPEGGLYLIMGDFSGHGLTAAMGTLPVALIFFNMVSESAAIGDIAREINKELFKLMPHSMFLAATLLELNARGDIISVWMGGVPESYCLDKKGELKNIIHAQHMPLGILDNAEFDPATQVFDVDTGDKVYLYSDGITEAKNSEGEQFGDERLENILITHNENHFDKILKSLKSFTSDNEQKDDITLVELTCQAIPAEQEEECLVSTLPWNISISLSEKEMCKSEPISMLSEILGSLPAMVRHKGVLHTLLSEMYVNAIDHSILVLESEDKDSDENFVEYYKKREERLHELKDAFINFEFSFYPEPNRGHLHIRMKDSGQGFQSANVSDSDELLHGRGLDIIRSFCEKVTFSDDGKTLDVIYQL